MSYSYKRGEETAKSIPFRSIFLPNKKMEITKGTTITVDGVKRKIESIRKVEMVNGDVVVFGKCR